jgi:hypothetical protein
MKPLDPQRESRSEKERTDLVHRIIQAIPSVVTFPAAQTRSPSFSLPSSSMTTTNSPFLYASIASGTGSKVKGEGGVVGGCDIRRGADMVFECNLSNFD